MELGFRRLRCTLKPSGALRGERRGRLAGPVNERSPLRILIADDEEDARTLLAEIIDHEPTLELVGVAADSEEVIRLARGVEADVALLDWMMPGGGAKAAETIRELKLELRVIAITAGDPAVAAYEMLSSGAIAFLRKGCPPAEIVDAIHAAVRG